MKTFWKGESVKDILNNVTVIFLAGTLLASSVVLAGEKAIRRAIGEKVVGRYMRAIVTQGSIFRSVPGMNSTMPGL